MKYLSLLFGLLGFLHRIKQLYINCGEKSYTFIFLNMIVSVGQYVLFLWATYSLLCQSPFYPKTILFFSFFITVVYCMQSTHYFTSISNLFLLHDRSKVSKWNWNLFSVLTFASTTVVLYIELQTFWICEIISGYNR